MRKKLVVTLLAASMMGSMLAGCGGGSGTSGEEGKESSKKGDTIKVMCVGTEAETYIDAYNSIAEKFSENNEYGVDVEIEFYENVFLYSVARMQKLHLIHFRSLQKIMQTDKRNQNFIFNSTEHL